MSSGKAEPLHPRPEMTYDRAVRNEKRTDLILIILLAAAVSAPLYLNGLVMPNPGHDLEFHLQRIAGLASSFQAGLFPSLIEPWWIRGMGYAVSVFYPDLFLVPSALLLMAGVSLEWSYKIMVIGINLASGFIAYRSFSRMFGNRRTAWLGTLLYVLAPYRLTDLYLRNALGESLALMFLPAAAEGIHACYEKPEDRRAWLRTALAYAGICCSHPLSLFMAALFTLLYALMRFRRTFSRQVLIPLLKAAGTAIVLSAWFLVPMVWMSRGNALYMNAMYRDVYSEAVYPQQLLAFFSPVRGGSLHPDAGTAGEMPYYLGWSLLAGLAYCLYLLIRRKGGKECLRVSVLALIAMWMTTCWFPYDRLQQIPWTDYLVTKVQYPWRFEMEAVLLLSIAGMIAYQSLDHQKAARAAAAVMSLAGLQACLHLGSTVKNASLGHVWSVADLDSSNFMGGEFLPAQFSEDSLKMGTLDPTATGGRIVSFSKAGISTSTGIVNDTGQDQVLTLPQVYYSEYQAVLAESGTVLQTENLGDGRLSIVIPAGCSGTVRTSLPLPFYVRLSLPVSIAMLGWILWDRDGFRKG